MIQQVTIQMTSARTYVLEGNKKCDQLNPKELMLLAGVTCGGDSRVPNSCWHRSSTLLFLLQ